MSDKHKTENNPENKSQNKVQIKQSHTGDGKNQASSDPSPSMVLLAVLTSSHMAYLFAQR